MVQTWGQKRKNSWEALAKSSPNEHTLTNIYLHPLHSQIHVLLKFDTMRITDTYYCSNKSTVLEQCWALRWSLHQPVFTGIPNKNERATDTCFDLVGYHQCDIMIDVLRWLSAYDTGTRLTRSPYHITPDLLFMCALTCIHAEWTVQCQPNACQFV